MSQLGMTPREAAHVYADHGLRVIPIIPGDKRPPMDAWQLHATTDHEMIDEWWGRWTDHGVGIATGSGSMNVFVVDVDPAKGGDEFWFDLCADHPPLPDTAHVLTGGDGDHYFFRAPDGIEIPSRNNGLGPGVDIKAEGGQVVAPPTVHPSGKEYVWEVEHNLDTCGIAEAPQWLVDEARGPTGDAPRLPRQVRQRPLDILKPGDRFDAETDVAELVVDMLGGTITGQRVDRETGLPYLLVGRPPFPGEEGWHLHTSGTIGYKGSNVLKVFTPNWWGVDPDTGEVWRLEDQQTYSPFGILAVRSFSGDFSAAARHLAATQTDPSETDSEPEPEATESSDSAKKLPTAYPDDQRSLPPFPDVLDPIGAAEVAKIAHRQQVPPDLAAQLVLGCYAACATGHIEIQVAPDWVEPANLYLGVALASGEGKSPVEKIIVGPLRDWEAERREASEKDRQAAAQTKKIAADKAAKLHDQAVKGHVTEAEAVTAALEAEAIDVPAPFRMFADDATPERLTDLIADHDSRMSIISTEADMLDTAAGTYANAKGKVNVKVYLKAWSGDPITRDRTGSGGSGAIERIIRRPLLTACLTVQPDHLYALRGQNAELRARGLFARFMFAVPASMVGYRDHFAIFDDIDDTGWSTHIRAMAERMVPWKVPVRLHMAPEAGRALIAWRQALEPRLRLGGDLESVRDVFAKLAGSVGRAAGLLHMADDRRHDDPISLETMNRAIKLGEYWLAHAVWMNTASAGSVEADAAAILDVIERTDLSEFTPGDICRRMRSRVSSVTDLVPALRWLIDHGWCSLEQGTLAEVGIRGSRVLVRSGHSPAEIAALRAAHTAERESTRGSTRTSIGGSESTFLSKNPPLPSTLKNGGVLAVLDDPPLTATESDDPLAVLDELSLDPEEDL